MENKLTIEIGEDKLGKIKIQSENGIETKYVTVEQIVEMFSSASTLEKQEEQFIKSPILPQFIGISTIQYLENENTQIYVLKKEACRMDLSYFGDKFENVGIPTLLFKIKISNNSIKAVSVVAVKDVIITSETMVYKYPFSNVFSDTHICLGGNNIAALDVNETAFIYRIPNLILSLDNNNDAYCNANSSTLPMRELLTNLSNNDFNEDWLTHLYNYDNWIK